MGGANTNNSTTKKVLIQTQIPLLIIPSKKKSKLFQFIYIRIIMK